MSKPNHDKAQKRHIGKIIRVIALSIAVGIGMLVFLIVSIAVKIVAADRLLEAAQPDMKVEESLVDKLKREKKDPPIPQNVSTGQDLIVLIGVSPAEFGNALKFRNFKLDMEAWYYMPWWGMGKKDAYVVQCTGSYEGDTPELLIDGKYVQTDFVPTYVTKDLRYWHEWTNLRPPAGYVKGKPALYKELGANQRPDPTDGTMIYALVVAVGPNAGKAGAVFTRP